MSVAEPDRRTVRWHRVLVLVPLAVFLGLTVLFLIQLNAGDPSLVPSALIGHPAPQTTLPPIAGLERDGAPVPGIAPADFKGAVTVVNVWASWCVPCHDEAPLLEQIAKDNRFRLVGINYKDDPDNARRFLGRYGDPREPGVDAIDWVERIPFSETRNYVQRVMENLQVYRTRFGGGARLMIEADLRRGAAEN